MMATWPPCLSAAHSASSVSVAPAGMPTMQRRTRAARNRNRMTAILSRADQIDNRSCDVGGSMRAAEFGRADAGVGEPGGDCLFEDTSGIEACIVAVLLAQPFAHHPRRQEHGRRVGPAGSGDVRGRAVEGLG